MPIYEYQCTECGERHEVIQKFNDEPLAHCPKCSGAMKKLFSSPAIQFKGSGFYKTDYGSGTSSRGSESKSDSAKGDSSSGANASSSSSSDSKSDSKSESKTESKSESKADTKAAS